MDPDADRFRALDDASVEVMNGVGEMLSQDLGAYAQPHYVERYNRLLEVAMTAASDVDPPRWPAVIQFGRTTCGEVLAGFGMIIGNLSKTRRGLSRF